MITRSRAGAAAESSRAGAAAESSRSGAAAESSRAGVSQSSEGEDLLVQKLQKKNKVLKEQLTKTNDCLNWYVKNEVTWHAKLKETRVLLEAEQKRHAEIETSLSKKTEELTQQLIITLQTSHQEITEQREGFKKEIEYLRDELRRAKIDDDKKLELHGISNRVEDIALSKTYELEEICSSQQDQIKSLQYQLTAANEKLEKADLTTIKIKTELEAKIRMVDCLNSRVICLENQLVEGEKLRKKLHNTILELKGNIRVFCRVRPTLPAIDCSGDGNTVVSYPTGVEYLGRGINLMHNAQRYSFTFDKVFSHEASQDDVFHEISQLVQSALDGYKVCIFAYGQTGSGKSYTMMGLQEQKGLIPRSVEQIFKTIQDLKDQGWKYEVQVSMLEIYNETIRDLLSPSRCKNIDLTHANKQHTIKLDSAGNTFVTGLTVIDVCNINEVSFLLNQAVHSRSVGKTKMNEQSSRSHFVFTLRISGNCDSTQQQVQGVLNLIDLAGSERLSKSGSTGDSLKETQAINKSLSSLSDVIFAIAKKDEYIPFRNSKLTYLLQPYLGGDSKTLMFVNISPEASSAGESICSLRFASRVNSCKIGVPLLYRQTRPSDSRLIHE